MNSVYSFVPGLGNLFVRDVYLAGSEDSDELLSQMHIRARVQSGDYFATLATELDKLAQGLNTAKAPEATDLERMVAELLYVHAHYAIRKK